MIACDSQKGTKKTFNFIFNWQLCQAVKQTKKIYASFRQSSCQPCKVHEVLKSYVPLYESPLQLQVYSVLQLKLEERKNNEIKQRMLKGKLWETFILGKGSKDVE